MHPYFWILISVAGLYAFIKLVYAIAVLTAGGSRKLRTDRTISILIAARNEEGNILECLQSLDALNYPRENLEIIVGDDGSEDNTARIVKEFAASRDYIRYELITEKIGHLHGKQNVLAQLARKANNDLILVTDADVTVPKNWASHLVAELNEKQALVCGSTIVQGSGLFAKMQMVDWLLGFTYNKAHDILGSPISAVGNNMAFEKKAYEEIGGYEKIGFSITEDFVLFHAMVEKGPFEYKQLLHPNSLNKTKPAKSISDWIRQRRRWYLGAKALPFRNVLPMIFNGIVTPILLIGLFFLPAEHVLFALAGKVIVDFILLFVASFKIERPDILIWFPFYVVFYEVYVLFMPLLIAAPGGVKWKGRHYEQNQVAIENPAGN